MKEKFCGFHRLSLNHANFPDECSKQIESLFSAFPISTDEARFSKAFPLYIWIKSSGPQNFLSLNLCCLVIWHIYRWVKLLGVAL